MGRDRNTCQGCVPHFLPPSPRQDVSHLLQTWLTFWWLVVCCQEMYGLLWLMAGSSKPVSLYGKTFISKGGLFQELPLTFEPFGVFSLLKFSSSYSISAHFPWLTKAGIYLRRDETTLLFTVNDNKDISVSQNKILLSAANRRTICCQLLSSSIWLSWPLETTKEKPVVLILL